MASLTATQTATALQTAIKKRPDLLHNVLGNVTDGFYNYIGLTSGITDEWVLGIVGATSVVQPGVGSGFSANGSFSIANHTGVLKRASVDLSFDQTELDKMKSIFENSIEGQALINSAKFSDVPNASLMLETIFAQIRKDIYYHMAFNGVAGGADTIKARNVADGYKKLIATAIATPSGAKTIPAGNVLTGAVITQSNAFDQAMAVYNLLPEDKKTDTNWVMMMSPEVNRLVTMDYNATYNSGGFNDARLWNLLKALPFANCEIQSYPGLTGSQRIILTQKKNFEVGMTNEGDITNMFIENKKGRLIEINTDFKIGFGINDYSNVYVNDQV